MEKTSLDTPEYKLHTLADMSDDVAKLLENKEPDADMIEKIDVAYKAIASIHQNLIEPLTEATVDSGTQVKRLATLSRLGLVDRSVIPTLSKLLKVLEDEKAVLSPIQRKNALKLLTGLIDLVTGDLLYNKAVAAERAS